MITFERAYVAHMGDLMFNRRHPVVDRAAGATLRGWMDVLDRTVADHADDTGRDPLTVAYEELTAG